MMRGLNVLLLCAAFLFRALSGESPRTIDVAHSTLTIHVSKTGLFSAFGHNHEIEAPIEEGQVAESGKLSVSLRVDARKLKVLDTRRREVERAGARNHVGTTGVRYGALSRDSF